MVPYQLIQALAAHIARHCGIAAEPVEFAIGELCRQLTKQGTPAEFKPMLEGLSGYAPSVCALENDD